MPSVCKVTAVGLGLLASARGWLCYTVKKLLIYEGMWTTMQQYHPICLAASHAISLSLSPSHKQGRTEQKKNLPYCKWPHTQNTLMLEGKGKFILGLNKLNTTP
jgi:hypothetical protein